jgi:hypothetical protein
MKPAFGERWVITAAAAAAAMAVEVAEVAAAT